MPVLVATFWLKLHPILIFNALKTEDLLSLIEKIMVLHHRTAYKMKSDVHTTVT